MRRWLFARNRPDSFSKIRPASQASVVFVHEGGPSQVDTFDYKPELKRCHGRPLPFEKPKVQFAKTGNLLASPWEFKRYGECGHAVSELFPEVAKQVDDLCFIHSMHGTNPAHGAAVLKLHTGSDNFIRPSMGSWVSYGLGSENENLPSFVSICPTLAHGGAQNWGSAFLPNSHQGCPIGNASIDPKEARVGHISNKRDTFEQQKAQIRMIRSLNLHGSGSGLFATDRLRERIDEFEMAFRMQASIPLAQDLSRETQATKSLYGIDRSISENFGRQCLMARRFFGEWGAFCAGHAQCEQGSMGSAREFAKRPCGESRPSGSADCRIAFGFEGPWSAR